MKTYNVKVNGNDYSVSIDSVDDQFATVLVNGTKFNIELENSVLSAKIPVQRPQNTVAKPSAVSTASIITPRPASGGAASGLKSPLPGVILDLFVKEGETVAEGQKLMILEAMKMENDITADKAGVISKIAISKGSSVMEGDLLITIE